MTRVQTEVLIVGAGLGGVAAALRAAAMGARVALVANSHWVGGQLTSQGVCTPDENPWIERSGGTLQWLNLRRACRDHYRQHYTLAPNVTEPDLNVGNCWVSGLSVEPLVANSLLLDMLRGESQIVHYSGWTPVAAERRVNHVTAVNFRGELGAEMLVTAEYILDATDTGELLPLAGVEHSIGAESRTETGELLAPDRTHPEWIQPFTYPFALELRPKGEDHSIPCPTGYAEMRSLQNYSITDEFKSGFGDYGWWTYRRFLAAKMVADPRISCDVAMINTASNDFKGGIYPTGDAGLDRDALAQGRLASLCYIHWLQTECPREDGDGLGYPELKPRLDIFGNADGIAPDPYIRESRRIKALHTITAEEILKSTQPGPRALHHPDSLGIGHYHMDIHLGNTGETRQPGFPEEWPNTWPFQIPHGSLIPRTVINLLPACKNIGVTHLTNGAYRLHPIEWAIGEAAGALAAYAIRHRVMPRQVREQAEHLSALQTELIEAGVPIFWWGDIAPGSPRFAEGQRAGMAGEAGGGEGINYLPGDVPL